MPIIASGEHKVAGMLPGTHPPHLMNQNLPQFQSSRSRLPAITANYGTKHCFCDKMSIRHFSHPLVVRCILLSPNTIWDHKTMLPLLPDSELSFPRRRREIAHVGATADSILSRFSETLELSRRF